MHRPSWWYLVLVLALLVLYTQPVDPPLVWDERLVPLRRERPGRNPRRNRERWLRRRARWERQRPLQRRAVRRRRREQVLRRLLSCPTPTRASIAATSDGASLPTLPVGVETPAEAQPAAVADVRPDPLANLRQARGWIDHLAEQTLWAMLIQVRWPHGAACPCCGETDPQYLVQIDPDYRGGLGRWRCLVCAGAGDPGEGGTFTPLTGTLLDGMRVDVRTLWLIVEQFANGEASVETADEARVNRHTTDRLFRLLRAAIYQARTCEPIVLGPDDIAEMDEVYLTAGLKGHAGNLTLEREPRRRGLRRRGRGTWDSDRLPVFGLLCRGGQVRLFVLRNVQTDTIRPIVEQMVQRGARVYTDSYSIYHFLSREGYQHQTVNHGAGEYALDLDGDGHCEVHCNTMECTWSWLRKMIRTFRGVSKSLP